MGCNKQPKPKACIFCYWLWEQTDFKPILYSCGCINSPIGGKRIKKRMLLSLSCNEFTEDKPENESEKSIC